MAQWLSPGITFLRSQVLKSYLFLRFETIFYSILTFQPIMVAGSGFHLFGDGSCVVQLLSVAYIQVDPSLYNFSILGSFRGFWITRGT